MAHPIEWSLEAIEDLDSIAEYIARDSAFYAQSVVSKILSVARGISDQNLIGRIVHEMNDRLIRERFVYIYRLIYKINENSVMIVAIIHGKRLLEQVPERF